MIIIYKWHDKQKKSVCITSKLLLNADINVLFQTINHSIFKK